MTKAAKLRALITSGKLQFLMEAHSGLSAKIAEEAGFAGLWASGLSISAMLGVRDANEASWTQVLDVVEFMNDATRVPILLDGDTGYGNFNSVRRLVRKLEMRDIAGVCLEDKCFPKTNSYLGGSQELVPIDEFCGKIQAAKDTQTNRHFVVVARVEAFIAGYGLDEAMRRAEAYHAAGADAILIHSKESSPAEIFAFLDAWGNRVPVVLVPTKYWRTPTAEFQARNVSVVIWANHLLRASISAMQATATQLRRDDSLLNVEPQVAPLHEVFRLQGDEELQQAEGRYLPAARGGALSAVVLAAGGGADFGGLTTSTPKAMLKVQGRPILARLLDDLAHFGCRGVTVVRGHHAGAVDAPGARSVDNLDFATTGEAWSLALAEKDLVPGTVVAFGDIVLKRHIIQALLEEAGDGITLVVDSGLAGADVPDRVRADRADTGRISFAETRLLEIGDVTPAASHGAWIGLLHLGRAGADWLRDAVSAARADGTLRTARMSDLITRVVAAERPVRVVYTRGGWVNVNNLTDLLDAGGV